MNVDKYFHTVVVNMTDGPKMVHKTVVALKWYTDNHEHIGKQFSVESKSTLLCLKTQIANRAKIIAAKHSIAKLIISVSDTAWIFIF
jgi:hypothetical protein